VEEPETEMDEPTSKQSELKRSRIRSRGDRRKKRKEKDALAVRAMPMRASIMVDLKIGQALKRARFPE
jgi:hypothetical protein